jgi:RNA polymerase sigma-70 factor (ECF subfamily)
MAEGDEEAYRRFYELYFHRLLRYLTVLTRNEESAREVLQVTFLRVVRHARRFDSEASLWSWLTVLARSSAADERRRSRRYFGFLSRLFQRNQVEAAGASIEADSWLVELLEANLAGLPAEERELIQRKYFEGQSVRRIAEESQTTEKAIESRLTRIRARLKQTIFSQLKHER